MCRRLDDKGCLHPDKEETTSSCKRRCMAERAQPSRGAATQGIGAVKSSTEVMQSAHVDLRQECIEKIQQTLSDPGFVIICKGEPKATERACVAQNWNLVKLLRAWFQKRSTAQMMTVSH